MVANLVRQVRAAIAETSGACPVGPETPGLATHGIGTTGADTNAVGRIVAAVAATVKANLPGPDILTPEQRRGDPQRYQQHVLHVEPDGTFSVVGLVWLPGQATPIHDHLAWCVVAVLDGVEEETVYRPRGHGEQATLVPESVTRNVAGDISCCVPPGDIHRVANAGTRTAVSLHVYGADLRACGSSIKRTYALPVVGPAV